MNTNAELVKLNPVSLRDEVYDLLRRGILSHLYPPSFRFDLSALEEQLGISRTPLKEALQRLEAEGLVEIKARRGTFVTSLDPQEVAESFDVRRILECGAASLLMAHLTDDDVNHLRSINDRMIALLQEEDYQLVLQDYLEADRDFHRFFVQLAGNSQLSEFHARVNTHLQIARVGTSFAHADSIITQKEHEAILAALENRAADGLCRAMENHINLSKSRVLQVLQNE